MIVFIINLKLSLILIYNMKMKNGLINSVYVLNHKSVKTVVDIPNILLFITFRY